MKTRICWFALALIAILLFAGCAIPPAPATQPPAPTSAPAVSNATSAPAAANTTAPVAATGTPKRGGTLIAARSVEIHGFDPHKNPAYDNLRLYELVYNGLVFLNDKLEVAPELAASWKIENGGTKFTFSLRQGVKFHDGQEMTSADVKASYEHILDEKTASPIRAFFTDITTIDAPDKYTVVFNLKQPNAPFLTLMVSTNAAIVPKSAIDKGTLDTEIDGTGPFKMDKWVPDNYIRLVRNANFFITGQPYLDAIEYRVLPDEATILGGLRTKTIDWGLIQDIKTAVLAKKESSLTVLGGPGINVQVLGFNVSHKPLDNPLVRMAINCAVDRDEISKVVFLGEVAPSAPVTPKMNAAYQVLMSDLPCYKRDIAKSKSLLAQAGYPNGIKFNIVTRNFAPYPEFAQVLQSQMKEAGIQADLQIEEFGVFVNRWRQSDFDSYLSVTSHVPDPDFALFRTIHTGGSANPNQYSNKDIDALLDKGRIAQDPKERAGMYQEVQKLISQDLPYLFLVTDATYRVMGSYLKGYKHMPTGSLIYMRETWLDK